MGPYFKVDLEMILSLAHSLGHVAVGYRLSTITPTLSQRDGGGGGLTIVVWLIVVWLIVVSLCSMVVTV